MAHATSGSTPPLLALVGVLIGCAGGDASSEAPLTAVDPSLEQAWDAAAGELTVQGEAGRPWHPLDVDWTLQGATRATRDADGALRIDRPDGPLRVGPPHLDPPSASSDPVLVWDEGLVRLRGARRGDALPPRVVLPIGQPGSVWGAAERMRSGDAMASVGDLDGDGDDELLVATRWVEGEGSVSLHRGDPTGLGAAAWTWTAPGTEPRAVSVLGEAASFYVLTWPDPGLKAYGPVTLRRFVGGAGEPIEDWSQVLAPSGGEASWWLAPRSDGVLVGQTPAVGAERGRFQIDPAGQVVVSEASRPPENSPFVSRPDATCHRAALGAVEHASGWSACGRTVGERFGHAIAEGDFDGDGRGDVAISAPLAARGNEQDVGVVRVWRGTADGFAP